MAESRGQTLCILGCGKMGTAILSNIIDHPDVPFDNFIACVRSEKSQSALEAKFANSAKLTVVRDDNAGALEKSDVVIVAARSSDIREMLESLFRGSRGPINSRILEGKTLISFASDLEHHLNNGLYSCDDSQASGRVWIVQAHPYAAPQGLTMIGVPEDLPAKNWDTVNAIFQTIGETVRIPTSKLSTTQAVAVSTPAIFAAMCDALIDASVAVGVPRPTAESIIHQTMSGSAKMLQNGMSAAQLRDRVTPPEQGAISAIMVLEENAVRYHIGKALRRAVTVETHVSKGRPNHIR